MNQIYIELLILLLGFSVGVFSTLSLIEKPSWGLIVSPHSEKVGLSECRELHQIVNRLVYTLPPLMSSIILITIIVMFLWVIESNHSKVVLIISSVYLFQLILIIPKVPKSINTIKSPLHDRDTLRKGLRQLLLLHHQGLYMSLSTLTLIILLT